MKQQVKLIGGIFLFTLIIVVTGFLFIKQKPVIQKKVTTPQQTHFSLENAPTQSLVATVATFSGEVLWQSRVATQPAMLSSSRKIQQGEDLFTGSTGELTVGIPEVVSSTLSNNTHISIIQTLPANILFQQFSGSASYTGLSNQIPISVRGLDLLLTFKAAQVVVFVDEKKSLVDISVRLGPVTAAFTDTNNTTVVVTLNSGQHLRFNNNTKTETTY